MHQFVNFDLWPTYGGNPIGMKYKWDHYTLKKKKRSQLPIQCGEVEGREEESTMYSLQPNVGSEADGPRSTRALVSASKTPSLVGGPCVWWGGEQHEHCVSSRWMQAGGTGPLPSLRLERWVRVSWLTGVPGPGLGLVMPGYKQMAPLPISP